MLERRVVLAKTDQNISGVVLGGNRVPARSVVKSRAERWVAVIRDAEDYYYQLIYAFSHYPHHHFSHLQTSKKLKLSLF